MKSTTAYRPKSNLLYTGVQEAFNNIVHHAQASHVEIYFHSHAGQVELTIRDNGVGFDTTQAPVARMGLSIMNNRIQSIGAQLEIISIKMKEPRSKSPGKTHKCFSFP